LLGNTANEAFLDDILPLLTHENAEVRVRAVFALRLFRDEQAVIALKHQLSVDQNPQVKRKAAEALSYFYPTYSDSNNSTP
jgi:HEAT repeat protein